MLTYVILLLAGAMLVGFVVLVVLWAVTEELPRTAQVPFYARLEPGDWGVRLLGTGRRTMRVMRVVNEVLGGDIGAAKALVDHPPSVIAEGITQALAQEFVAALRKAGAQAEVFALDPLSAEAMPES